MLWFGFSTLCLFLSFGSISLYFLFLFATLWLWSMKIVEIIIAFMFHYVPKKNLFSILLKVLMQVF